MLLLGMQIFMDKIPMSLVINFNLDMVRLLLDMQDYWETGSNKATIPINAPIKFKRNNLFLGMYLKPFYCKKKPNMTYF